jgi:hypothetical protein
MFFSSFFKKRLHIVVKKVFFSLLNSLNILKTRTIISKFKAVFGYYHFKLFYHIGSAKFNAYFLNIENYFLL